MAVLPDPHTVHSLFTPGIFKQFKSEHSISDVRHGGLDLDNTLVNSWTNAHIVVVAVLCNNEHPDNGQH